MPLAFAQLTQGSSNTDASSYATASITPSTDSLLLLALHLPSSVNANTPIVTGNGLTWQRADYCYYDQVNPHYFVMLYWALTGESPSAGVVTIDLEGQVQLGAAWTITQVTGDVPDYVPILQTAISPMPGSTGTGVTVTLGGTPESDSAVFALVGTESSTAITVEAGWTGGTAITTTTPVSNLRSAWNTTPDPSCTFAWGATSTLHGAIIAEIGVQRFGSLHDITGSPDNVGTAPVHPVTRDRNEGPVLNTVSGSERGKIVLGESRMLATGGVVTVEPRLYMCTMTGVPTSEISDLMLGAGRVTCDPDGDPIWSFEADALWSDDLPDAFADWVTPVVDMITPRADGRGNERTRYQLGVYKVRPYPLAADQWGGVVRMRGYDALWTLRADINGSAYTVNAGVNIRTAITTLLTARGYTTHNIAPTTETMPKKKTWLSGTPWLKILNDLCRIGGFYPLHLDMKGIPTTRPFEKIGSLTPAATYTASDVLDQVLREADEERFANHVVILGNSPSGTSYRATRTNNDPSSPSSTVALGFTKGIFEKSPDYKTQRAVDARADYLMERANSLQVRMEVNTKMLREFRFYEAVAFDLETNAGQQVASGKWRLERMEVEVGVRCHPRWTVAQLQDFEDVA